MARMLLAPDGLKSETFRMQRPIHTGILNRLSGSARSERLRFGAFRFDQATCRLSENGHTRRLRPQSARLLALLTERAGQLVTRDEIIETLWSGLTVNSDNSIDACMRDIRRALGDAASEPRYIKTHPRLGYEFIAPVRSSNRSTLVFAGLAAGVAALIPAAAMILAGGSFPAENRFAFQLPEGSAAPSPSLKAPAVTIISEDRALAEAVRERLSIFPPHIIQLLPADNPASGAASRYRPSHAVLLEPDEGSVRLKIIVLEGADSTYSASFSAGSADPARLAEEILRTVHLPENVLRELSASEPEA